MYSHHPAYLQSSAIANSLELTVKTLPGEHVRPLQQDLNQISPELVGGSRVVMVSNDYSVRCGGCSRTSTRFRQSWWVAAAW